MSVEPTDNGSYSLECEIVVQISIVLVAAQVDDFLALFQPMERKTTAKHLCSIVRSEIHEIMEQGITVQGAFRSISIQSRSLFIRCKTNMRIYVAVTQREKIAAAMSRCSPALVSRLLSYGSGCDP